MRGSSDTYFARGTNSISKLDMKCWRCGNKMELEQAILGHSEEGHDLVCHFCNCSMEAKE